MRTSTTRCFECVLIAGVCAAAIAGMAGAQAMGPASSQRDDASQDKSATSMSAAPTGASSNDVTPPSDATTSHDVDSSNDVDPLQVFRAPLLREGSALIEAAATIARDPKRGWWNLRVEDSNAGESVRRELLLLPCTRLSEMQHIVEASPNRTVRFQVSGRVFVFHGHNFVLPTHAPVLSDDQPPTAASPSKSSNDLTASANPDPTKTHPAVASANPTKESPQTAPGSGNAPDRASDSAADIMRDLEKAAGSIRQSSAANLPFVDDRDDSEHQQVQAGKRLTEETEIVNRRGVITRDAAGGWVFVFDSDSNGLADPPMRLLPCLLLERIEDYARRQGNNSPALMSGAVYLYNGRNYLLPTVFRIPQDRRNLSP